MRRVEARGSTYWVSTELARPSDPAREPIEFLDQQDARAFLWDSMADCLSAGAWRAVAGELGHRPARLSRSDLAEELAWALCSQRIHVFRKARPITRSILRPRTDPIEQPSSPEPIRNQSVFVVRLETDAGLAIPAARFEAKLANGEQRSGTLDLKGEAVLMDVPPGPVVVTYPEPDDVAAKALAAAARQAFGTPDLGAVFELLHRAPVAVRQAIARYDAYFNDYTGNGFVKDAETVFTDPDARRVVEVLLARAGVAVPEPPVYLDRHQQDGA